MKKIVENSKISLAVCTVVIFLISLFSITGGSLWGDEICRVADPISGDIKATMQTALGYAQPGYMLYIMLWSHLAGATEFLLRCSNLPFVALAVVYVFKIVKSRGWSLWWSLVFFVHPMFVYYMDEATPYIIVYALSLAFVYYTFCVEEFSSCANLVKLNIIYLLGVFFHFMFGFIIVLYFANCFLQIRRERALVLRHIGIMACFSPFYIILLYLYATYLNSTTTGFGIKSILYVIYSFLGMQGVGLSRNDLRAGNWGSMQWWQIALLLLFVLTLLGILAVLVRARSSFVRRNQSMLISSVAFFAVIFICAAVVHMGLWERHCMSVFPVFLICLCDLLHEIWDKSILGKILFSAYFVLLLLSAVFIARLYYYSCDDYKGVTEYVSEQLRRDPALVVLDTGRINFSGYYSYAASAKDSARQLVDVSDKTEQEIINLIEGWKQDKIIQDKLIQDKFIQDKFILILFEKNVSRTLYHYFDNQSAYRVDDRFNSFRIVTPQ